jgi:hypothetical protein
MGLSIDLLIVAMDFFGNLELLRSNELKELVQHIYILDFREHGTRAQSRYDPFRKLYRGINNHPEPGNP